jgi:hypothetical protein
MVLILATAALAEDRQLSADIPFNFNFGEATMASGKYTIQMLDNTVLVIKSAENNKTVMTLTRSADGRQASSKPALVFNHYGDQYFLSGVSWAKGSSRALLESRLERETARKVGTPEKLDVAIK